MHTLSFPPALSLISHPLLPNTLSSFNCLLTYSSICQTISYLWHCTRLEWFCMSVEISDYMPGKYLGAKKLHQTCSCTMTVLHSLRNCAATQGKTGVDSCPLFSSPFGSELESGLIVLLLVVGSLSFGFVSGSPVPILVPPKSEALVLSLLLPPFYVSSCLSFREKNSQFLH